MIDTSAATEESEPIYGPLYLPRKFKTVIAVPPDNDVDIFAHDLGYIAIVEKGEVVGYNVTVGGGMGMTHGETDTFPRTADMLGFCTPEQAIDVGEKVVTVQRDWGNRAVRKNARLKYTIERVGIDAFRAEVEKRLGYKLGAPRPYAFTSTGDPIGWRQTLDGKAADKKWHLTLYVENGRVKDTATRADADGAARDRAGGRCRLRRDLEPEPRHRQRDGEAEAEDRGAAGEAWRRDWDVVGAAPQRDGVRGAADVRAGAGRERAVPAGARHGSGRHPRCGGSARGRHRHPHDRMPERVRAAVSGGDRVRGRGRPGFTTSISARRSTARGCRRLYAQDVNREQILKLLEPIIKRYAKERTEGEHFGDFVMRAGIVAATTAGNNFHENVVLAKV